MKRVKKTVLVLTCLIFIIALNGCTKKSQQTIGQDSIQKIANELYIAPNAIMERQWLIYRMFHKDM